VLGEFGHRLRRVPSGFIAHPKQRNGFFENMNRDG
jgi:hypothetical protein